MKKKIHLTILLCSRHDKWIAQCVEHDIAAQASSVEGVLYEIARTISAEIVVDCKHDREPLKGTPPAPDKFRELARNALKIENPRFPDFTLPSTLATRFEVQTEQELLLCTT